MNDYKNCTQINAYKNRLMIAASVAAIAMLCGGSVIASLVSENLTLQKELIDTLAVSENAADYMQRQGRGLVFTDMDLE
jgi:hypothetical protein